MQTEPRPTNEIIGWVGVAAMTLCGLWISTRTGQTCSSPGASSVHGSCSVALGGAFTGLAVVGGVGFISLVLVLSGRHLRRWAARRQAMPPPPPAPQIGRPPPRGLRSRSVDVTRPEPDLRAGCDDPDPADAR